MGSQRQLESRLCPCSVTKRRSSWACIGNPNPEQETSKGTHAQETAAYQRRPTTQHAAQGSNPPIGPLHMQLAKIPHTHHTTPPATRAASARYAWADIIQELLTRTIHRSCPGASLLVVRALGWYLLRPRWLPCWLICAWRTGGTQCGVMCGNFASCMYSALIEGLLPCTSYSVVGLCWWAGVSRACVPSMVSSSSLLQRVALVSDCLYMPNHCVSL